MRDEQKTQGWDLAESLIQTAQVIVLVLDTQGRILRFNSYMEHISGYRLEEVQGEEWFTAFLPEGDRTRIRELFQRAVAGIPTRGNVNPIVTKDGRERQIEWYDTTLKDADGNVVGLLSIGQDITQRVRAEEELRKYRDHLEEMVRERTAELARANEQLQQEIAERVRAKLFRDAVLEALQASEERYSKLFQHSNDAIFIHDLQGQIIDVNQKGLDLFGYTEPEALSLTVSDLHPPEAIGLSSQAFETIARDGFVKFEVDFKKKNGEVFPAEVSSSLFEIGEAQVIQEIVRDITERKQAEQALRESNRRLEETLAELRETQEQVVQQERLAAVGQLAAGIAHDFNNLLTGIIGYAELLLVSPDLPAAAQPDVARIVRQGQRAAHLVQQILDFSRKSIPRPQPLNLVPFLKEAAKLLEPTIPETIHTLLEIEPSECLVQADPTQLQQILTNLALNAQDAMPKGGELKLRLSHLTLEPGERPPCPEMPPGEWGVLSVSDTGTGIPAEILPHIFEPFFTTRAPQRSGLGLAQVYGIVKQHQGYIDVRSELNEGTKFIVYLPALVIGE